MYNETKKFGIHIGMRNIKTALAATLTALVYFLINRNPTFACIGAIFGVGSDLENSWLNGGNRFFGTIFGGVLGMILFRIYIIFYPEGNYPNGMDKAPDYHLLILLLLAIGVIVLVLISVFFKWPGAIQPGGVVLCIILFNTPVATYISYSINRMFDTGVGVAIALLVNVCLPREKVVNTLVKMNLRKEENGFDE